MYKNSSRMSQRTRCNFIRKTTRLMLCNNGYLPSESLLSTRERFAVKPDSTCNNYRALEG